MNKKLLIIISIILLSGVFIINKLNPSETLPINFNKVNKIINKARGGWYDKTSCPFSLSMFIYEGEKKTTIILGIDDCGFIIYNNKYYKIPEVDLKQF